MSSFQRSNAHTVSRLTIHIVRSTKYRFKVLDGDIKVRCRSILIWLCEAEDVRVLEVVVSKDHVHMHIEYRPSQSVSDLVRRMKGRCSRKLQQEFSELNKRYWGSPFLDNRFWLLEYWKY